MAANIHITCPDCGKKFRLRFDPGVEDEAPILAAMQLREECPDHDSHEWQPWVHGGRHE